MPFQTGKCHVKMENPETEMIPKLSWDCFLFHPIKLDHFGRMFAYQKLFLILTNHRSLICDTEKQFLLLANHGNDAWFPSVIAVLVSDNMSTTCTHKKV